MPKFMSLGEAETKRQQAIEFMERLGGDADKFREMDAAEYAESRGAELLENPSRRPKDMTKTDLAETLDQLADGLEEALDPELTRSEIVAKVKQLASIASGEDEDEDQDEDQDEAGDEDDDE
jgi:hypothetical protein